MTNLILAIDLGKYKSVFCWFDTISKGFESHDECANRIDPDARRWNRHSDSANGVCLRLCGQLDSHRLHPDRAESRRNLRAKRF